MLLTQVKRIPAFIRCQERCRLARSRLHKAKFAAEDERLHDITVDNESSLHATMYATAHDNAVAVSAGAVPATQAGGRTAPC